MAISELFRQFPYLQAYNSDGKTKQGLSRTYKVVQRFILISRIDFEMVEIQNCLLFSAPIKIYRRKIILWRVFSYFCHCTYRKRWIAKRDSLEVQCRTARGRVSTPAVQGLFPAPVIIFSLSFTEYNILRVRKTGFNVYHIRIKPVSDSDITFSSIMLSG